MRIIIFWESEGGRDAGRLLVDTSVMPGTLAVRAEALADHEDLDMNLFEALGYYDNAALVPGHIDRVLHLYTD